MSQYIVSARKYRPDSFETLLGQDNIARTLSNSIKRGQLAHAYLFCGPRGVGKTTTARIFAKMINCAHPGPEMEPCGQCESCVSFQEGRSYCIHELDAASNNSVEDIKSLMEKVQVPPQVGKYSVYIIDEVHMLSQAAFNAFLKTLEEPPAHAIFILATTEKHKILPTILSRCQTYDFNRISIADMVRNLRGIAAKEGVSIDDESLHVIASKADGAMRDALTIFDQTVAFCGTDIHYEDVIRNLNVLDYEYSFSMVEDFLSGNYGAALTTFDEVLGKGFNALHFVAALSSHLRDLVVARTAGLDSLLELPDSLKKRYQEQAARCPLQFLYEALNITTACETGYKAAVNPRLHIEFTLMKLSFLTGAAGVSTAPRPVAVPKPAPAEKPAPQVKPVPQVQPVPAEKPVPQEQLAPADKTAVAQKPAPPAPAPERRKRVPKTGSSLSMNAIMEEKEQKPEEEVPASPVPGALPSNEEIEGKWKELADKFSSRPRLSNAMTQTKLRIEEGDGVKSVYFTVSNAAQKQWIEEKLLRELENTFREILSSVKVNLHVDEIPEEESGEKIPYMPEEKARDLMDKNPEVRAFVADLGLDTK
ncbi:MAG: DNA polymerase III subunit gamma/tau [Bacteroidales bacterium]|nr:DNA polymerase III subunit gamma/tau [Bacteroidales bacterium]